MSNYWAPLAKENYINLETFKKNGAGVKTPVWFARQGDVLVFMTKRDSWKVKRLKRNSTVKLAACGVTGKVHGEWLEATCHPIDGVEEKAAEKTLAKKYLSFRWYTPLLRLIGKTKERQYYRIDQP